MAKSKPVKGKSSASAKPKIDPNAFFKAKLDSMIVEEPLKVYVNKKMTN